MEVFRVVDAAVKGIIYEEIDLAVIDVEVFSGKLIPGSQEQFTGGGINAVRIQSEISSPVKQMVNSFEAIGLADNGGAEFPLQVIRYFPLQFRLFPVRRFFASCMAIWQTCGPSVSRILP